MLKLGKVGTHVILYHAFTNVYQYENGKYVYSFPLSVGLERGGDDSFVNIKGNISTGSPFYEDRPCFHTDVDGLIYATTSEKRPVPHQCGFGFTLGSSSLIEIITGPCDKVRHFFSRDSRGRTIETYFYYGMQGNNLYQGITSRIVPSVGPPLLFPDVYFVYQTLNTLRTKSSINTNVWVPWKGDFHIPSFQDKPTNGTPAVRATLDVTAQQFDRLYYLIHKFLSNMNLKEICPQAVPLPPSHPVFGDLAVKALDSAKFIDANLVAFLSEYQSLNSLFSGLQKDILSGRLSEAYLGYNYGLRNQVSDYITITAGLEKTLKMRERQPLEALRASLRLEVPDTTIRKEYHYKIRYRPQSSQGTALLKTLREYSLLPTLVTAWDLVPFSFVVDWFYSFQRELERFQFRTDYLLYDIVAITKSEKITFSIKDTFLADVYPELNGILFTIYRRYISDVVDQPSYFFTDGYVPNPGRHIVEAACLLMKQ